MSSAASRLTRFSHNASLQNLIQRHLLRPSASAASGGSVSQLLNAVTEPRLWSLFNTENPTPYLNTLLPQNASCDASGIMKKYNFDCDVSMIMFGLSSVDQHGNIKIHTRRRVGFDEDDVAPYPNSDSDSRDEAFGEHDEFADEDDDADENDFDDNDDLDEDPTRRGKF